MHWGPVLHRSDDLGATWSEHDQASVAFPDDAGVALARIWQLAPGPVDQPDVLRAGVEPAAPFRSDDGGRTFSLVRGRWGSIPTVRSGNRAAAACASTPFSCTPPMPSERDRL